MAGNKMKKFAELLDVEIDVPFNIKGYMYNPCLLTDSKIMNRHGISLESTLFRLLNGELEIEKQILNESEKRYLENLFRPFKDIIVYIEKVSQSGFECISYQISYEYISYKSSSPTIRREKKSYELPYFNKGTMYKGMVLEKKYSLEELGLFEGDGEDVD